MPTRRALAFALPLAGTVAALAAALSPASAQIITAAPTYFEAKGKLTEAEMQATFSGRSREEGTDAQGNNWSVQASPTGQLTVSSGEFTDTGHARIDGLMLCVSWQKAWKGAEHCFRYAHHGRQLASYGLDGRLDSVVTITR